MKNLLEKTMIEYKSYVNDFNKHYFPSNSNHRNYDFKRVKKSNKKR